MLVHNFLIHVALFLVQNKDQASPASVSFGYISTLLARLLGVGRTALNDYLTILQSVGLISYKGRAVRKKVDGKQESRYDGSVIRVSLRSDVKASLSQHDFTFKREGCCAKYLLKSEQLLNQLETVEKIKLLLNPSLPSTSNNLPSFVVVQFTPGEVAGQIKALATVPRAQRREAVEDTARALSSALSDQHSFNWWKRCLWRLLWLHDSGKNPPDSTCLCIQFSNRIARVLATKSEGAARNPGALAHHELKRWGWWDELERATPAKYLALSA